MSLGWWFMTIKGAQGDLSERKSFIKNLTFVRCAANAYVRISSAWGQNVRLPESCYLMPTIVMLRFLCHLRRREQCV